MSEEDKWWSPDHVADEGNTAFSQNTAGDSSKEEIVGRENIDNFLDDIGYSDSDSKRPKRTTTTGGDSTPTPQPPIVSGSQGFLGLWWLTRKEAFFVIVAIVFALVISAIWTIGLINESTYVEVSATIETDSNVFWIEGEAEISGDGTWGTGWFMDDLSGWYEDCWTDEDGYEYCDSYYVVEYECYADLFLTWNVSGVEHNGWAYTPSIITPYGCLEIMEQYYEIGDNMPIWYADSDPSQFQAFAIKLGNSESTHWMETMYHWTEGPNLYTDYECEAVLTVTYIDPSDNTSQITTRILDGWGDGPALYWTLSENSCIMEIMNEYSDGKTIVVEVDETDSSKAYQLGQTPDGFFAITWFCCLGMMVIFVIISFVFIRFGNTPPGSYVTRNGVVHHGGYDGNDVTIINNHYGNRWGYNEGPGVHYRKPSRRVSSRRTRSSSSSSRSSGGHSTRGRSGGGSSSGGGSRSSGGGRSGGGRSGGRR
jgi:hypothetical protein